MAVEMKDSRMQNKFFSFHFISCLLLVILLAGCATPAKRMARISLGMSKEQVCQKLGDPTVARGAIRNKFDQPVEVLEYRLALPEDAGANVAFTTATFEIGAFVHRDIKNYWLYFVEDKLVRWGESGRLGQRGEPNLRIPIQSLSPTLTSSSFPLVPPLCKK